MTTNLVSALIAERPDWLAFLQETFKIKASYSECGRLVSLKYDQTESPMGEEIVQQCRGMVVDVISGVVLAWPYNKFWNHGEARAANVDWDSAWCLEKLDGSLMQLFWDPHPDCGWSVASSGHPTAGGSFGNHESMTFSDAFWQLFTSNGYSLPDAQWRDTTFMFELCALENRIVVRHQEPRLVLHGARLLAGSEFSLPSLENIAEALKWECVKHYPLSSPEECLSAALQLDPISGEGFVVVDANHNRVKIKSPKYVALHHMRGEFSQRRAVELWQTGETPELLVHFPEFASVLGPIHASLDAVVNGAWDFLLPFSTGEAWPSRKAFAEVVKVLPFSNIAFRVYGRTSFTKDDLASLLRQQSLASLERLADV